MEKLAPFPTSQAYSLPVHPTDSVVTRHRSITQYTTRATGALFLNQIQSLAELPPWQQQFEGKWSKFCYLLTISVTHSLEACSCSAYYAPYIMPPKLDKNVILVGF